MTAKRLAQAGIICLALCMLFAVALDDAHAQKMVRGVLQEEVKEKEPDGPTKLQMVIGVGSMILMIGIVKWV